MVSPNPLAAANRDLGQLIVEVHARAIQLIVRMAAIVHPIFVTEGYRSPERQEYLYAQGRTRPGSVVTKARANKSWHQTRRAFDVAFVPRWKGDNPFSPDHPWKELGRIGKSIGLTWGGVSDMPHFEFKGGLKLSQAIEKAKEFQS